MLRLVRRWVSGASTCDLQKKKLLFMDRLAELMMDDSHDERSEIAAVLLPISLCVCEVERNERRQSSPPPLVRINRVRRGREQAPNRVLSPQLLPNLSLRRCSGCVQGTAYMR